MKNVNLILVVVGLLIGCNQPSGPGPTETHSLSDNSANQPVNPGGSALNPTSVNALVSISVAKITASSDPLVSIASCGTNEILTGGGCECLDHPSYAGRIKIQLPENNTMRCECVNTSGQANNHLARAHALCMSTVSHSVISGL